MENCSAMEVSWFLGFGDELGELGSFEVHVIRHSTLNVHVRFKHNPI